MVKKSLKCVRSVPQVASRCGDNKDSQCSSSSSLAEKKAVEKTSRSGLKRTNPVPKHLVSHMTPYFYPDDYELDSSDDDTTATVPRHLVSHVTTYCYPVTGTVDDEDTHSSRSDVVPSHLESHLTPYCHPVADDSATIDDSRPTSPKTRRHLESHVTLQHCQPADDNDDIVENNTTAKLANSQRADYDPRQLRSHLFDSDNNHESDDESTRRTAICCEMTRDHANTREAVFADDDKPPRRFGRRRLADDQCNLFEESKPKPQRMSLTIVPRAPENTKANIFGLESSKTSRPPRPWENDTKKTIFGCEADYEVAHTHVPSICRHETKKTILSFEPDFEQTPTLSPRSCKYEDTKEKLFGETYGIKEAEEEHARRRRPLREDTQKTLFGPSTAPTPQRPQSARSFTSTHDNLFGQQASQSNRRMLRRENTFDNLFGATSKLRPVVGPDTNLRYTRKSPKVVEVSCKFVVVTGGYSRLLIVSLSRSRMGHVALGNITHIQRSAGERLFSDRLCSGHLFQLQHSQAVRLSNVHLGLYIRQGVTCPIEVTCYGANNRPIFIITLAISSTTA